MSRERHPDRSAISLPRVPTGRFKRRSSWSRLFWLERPVRRFCVLRSDGLHLLPCVREIPCPRPSRLWKICQFVMPNVLRVTVGSRSAGDKCRASEVADVRQRYARLALSMEWKNHKKAEAIRKKEERSRKRPRTDKKKRQEPKKLQVQEWMMKLTRQITLWVLLELCDPLVEVLLLLLTVL